MKVKYLNFKYTRLKGYNNELATIPCMNNIMLIMKHQYETLNVFTYTAAVISNKQRRVRLSHNKIL